MIKRVEKLLALAEKRDIQSATTIVQKDRKSRERFGKRKPNGASLAGDDELLEIAHTAARRRNTEGKDAGEGVVIRGTGKAVQKVLDFGLWFQQREDRFIVSLRTGSVGAIDDIEAPDEIEMDDQDDSTKDKAVDGAETVDDASKDEQDAEMTDTAGELVTRKIAGNTDVEKSSDTAISSFSETRVHYTSSLEVSVRLR